MKIYVLIIFLLATVRSIVPLAKKDSGGSEFIANILFAISHILAFYWLAKDYITIN